MKGIDWIQNKLQELGKNDTRDVYLMDHDIPAEVKFKIPDLLENLQNHHILVEYSVGFGTNTSDFKPLEARFLPGRGQVIKDPYQTLADQAPEALEKGAEVIYYLKLNPSELSNTSEADPGSVWEKMMDDKFKEEGPFMHITDPKLKELYKKINRDDYYVIVTGDKMVKKAKDKLAVLEAMQQSTQNVIGDFGEHGDDNKELYDNHPETYFEEKLKEIGGQIKKLKDEGESSNIYSNYKTAYDAWFKALPIE